MKILNRLFVLLTALVVAAIIALFLPVSVPTQADTITIPHAFSAGTVIKSSDFNANFTAITTAVNGNLDDVNFKAGGIDGLTKLASNSVDTDELAANAVTTAQVIDGTLLPADMDTTNSVTTGDYLVAAAGADFTWITPGYGATNTDWCYPLFRTTAFGPGAAVFYDHFGPISEMYKAASLAPGAATWTVRQLKVSCLDAIVTNTVTIEMYKCTYDTSSCTAAATGLTCDVAAGDRTCSDVVNTFTFSGDEAIAFKTTQAGAGGCTYIAMSVCLDPS
jgi:hypothetical protein